MASKDLKIERLGGIAGYGSPNSRLKSRGSCATAALAKADQEAVERLFAARSKSKGPAFPDGFYYRITRETAKGHETVEVPEASVPAALVACVKDEIV
jgi:hypothetical protein